MVLIATESFAQNQKENNKLTVHSFSTEVLLSTDLEASFFNYIGAGIKYTRGYTTVSFTVYPALRFHNDRPVDSSIKCKPFIIPGLAIGPLVQHKRLQVGMPIFYVASEAKWHFTFGVGYIFGK